MTGSYGHSVGRFACCLVARGRRLAAVGALLVSAGAAPGQILPPAPGAARERERFELPPLPVARPTPVEPRRESVAAPPAPDLVRLDEAGRLIRLEVPAEEAALLAMSFDDETMAAVLRALEARRVEMEKKVYANLDALVDTLEMVEVRSFEGGATLELLQEASQRAGVFTTDSLLDWMQRGGVITPLARTRAKSAADAYGRALTADAAKVFENNAGDWDNMTRAAFRTTMGNLIAEARQALDVMLADSAQTGALGRLLGRDVSELSTADRRGAFVTDLTGEQRREALRAVRPGIDEGE